MIKEIYCRMPSDPKYEEGRIHIDDEVSALLQRIRICLGTRQGEVLGDPYFGIDLADYLFDMSYDKAAIEAAIMENLTDYVIAPFASERGYDVSVDVEFGKDPQARADYMLVDISINGEKLLGILVTV